MSNFALGRCSVALAAIIASSGLGVGCDSDGAVDGARGNCAVGGAITTCATSPTTSTQACDKLVDCGAIPVDHDSDGGMDWGRCMDTLEGAQADRQSFMISCIAASSCDELRTDGSPSNPYDRIYCLSFGER